MQVVVLNQSDPLRQVLQFITERGNSVEIAAETDAETDLPKLIARTRPEYLFLLQNDYDSVKPQISQLLSSHAEMDIAVVNEEEQQVLLYQSDYADQQAAEQNPDQPIEEWQGKAWIRYTLSDFIYLLTESSPRQDPPGGITDVEHHPYADPPESPINAR